MRQYPDRLKKLVYCSRTIPEMQKVMNELKQLFEYIEGLDDEQPVR